MRDVSSIARREAKKAMLCNKDSWSLLYLVSVGIRDVGQGMSQLYAVSKDQTRGTLSLKLFWICGKAATESRCDDFCCAGQ